MIMNVNINLVDFVENIILKNLLTIMNSNVIKEVLKDKIVIHKIILSNKVLIMIVLLMKIIYYSIKEVENMLQEE